MLKFDGKTFIENSENRVEFVRKSHIWHAYSVDVQSTITFSFQCMAYQ